MKFSQKEIAHGTLREDSLRAAARTFREAGYVVLERVYDPVWVAALRRDYDTLIAHYLADRGGIEALDGKTFGKNHVGLFPALCAPWSDPQIVSHPLVDQLLSELLGADYRCGFYNTNTAYPGSGIQPVHRDSPPLFTGAEMSVPHPPTSIVLNIPLCDFTEENGSTQVWPGTHLLVDRRPEDRQDLEARAAALPSERTNIAVGSLVLRDLRMFHRGMPNRSGDIRTMLAIVYGRAWQRTDGLEIPQTTWDSWPERTREIFRGNPVVPEATAAPHYRPH